MGCQASDQTQSRKDLLSPGIWGSKGGKGQRVTSSHIQLEAGTPKFQRPINSSSDPRGSLTRKWKLVLPWWSLKTSRTKYNIVSTQGLHHSVLLWPLPWGHLTHVCLLPTEWGSLSGPHYSLFISVHTQVCGFKLSLVLQTPPCSVVCFECRGPQMSMQFWVIWPGDKTNTLGPLRRGWFTRSDVGPKNLPGDSDERGPKNPLWKVLMSKSLCKWVGF